MIKIKAYAKINLYLDVIGKRPDGYHNIQTIIHQISLADELIIKLRDKGIKIICDKKDVPAGSKNLVYKAVKLLLEYIDKNNIKRKGFFNNKGVEIVIHKNIPVAGGLGGGSSDAAGTLIALNRLWGLRLSSGTLKKLGSRLGADVPFFIKGGAAYCYGRGDKTKNLDPIGDLGVVLVNPGFHISTEWAYKNLKLRLTKRENNNIIHRYHLVKKAKNNRYLKIKKVKALLYNSFEPLVTEAHPVIKNIKNDLESLGIKATLMSGSGSTVFGLFPTQKYGERIKEVLEKKGYPWIWVGKTMGGKK